ncbi:coiled-coil domain-containing protein 14 isoform X2 [Danio aesculapii]|uniref:coiled-coil domain-containing protein 14 isoform X2 n=1 Tax=Danio aesculapii TaxID=1142201 RepID=UPI0024BFED24|nr:coiled-coil domain-containing protein 14 isoform X2 [Danio aesculapii]
MARQGISRLKVVSSGRLTASGRGQIHKKKVAGTCVSPLEPGYSLYSTDSEDQVTTIHKGLDRCAALLNGILQAEQTESKPKPQGTKTCTFKSKPKNLSRKFEIDNKKKHWNKTKTAVHLSKRPAPVQKKILSAKCHVGLAGQLCSRNDQNPGIRKTQVSHDQASGLTLEHGQQISLSNSQPPASCNHPDQVYTSTVFNTRLTTSTPALSPQRPGSAPTEPCTLSSGCPSREFHQLRTMSVAIPSCPHGSVEISGIPNKHATTFSMPLAAQQQSPVAVLPLHNKSCTPVPASPVSSVHELGSVEPSVSLASSIGSLSCSSSTLTETQMSIHPQAETDPDGAVLMISNGQGNLEEDDGAEDEKEKHGMDITPVRDISCQTSTEKLTALTHKTKASPEKTAQKVMTVKYLLGELKTLVANHDGDAVRLISEVEQNISLLPVMVGSTNIQAEIALAVQPLRSENVQLRRRLRILNQQLLERERAERQTRPEACDMEVVALQSLNLALQTQLNESREELEVLQQENMRLRKATEDKDVDLKHLNDLCELENSRLRLDVSEALAEMQSCQSKLKASETEKMALNLSLQQREAEIGKLQDVIRNLQKSQTNNMRYSPHPDVSQPNSQLTKSVLELHEAAALDKPSNSVKTYLQTLEDIRQPSPSNHIKCRSQTLHPGQTDGEKDYVLHSDTKICLKTDRDVHKPTLETIAEDMPQLEDQKKTVFAPLRETPLVQLAHSDPFTHCNEQITARNHRKDVDVKMKYMGHGLEKLDISDGLHIQDAKCEGRDYLGVGLHLNQQNKGLNNQPVQSQYARRFPQLTVQSACTGRPSAVDSTFSSCDIKSLASDWSINSWSTFNTQDEQNFRDGLAALDASIESLQKTLKVDLNK